MLTSDKEFNPSCSLDLLLKGVALSLQVCRIPIQNVGVFGVDVNVLEEIIPHEGVVALWVLSRKTHILVHVEGFHIFEGQVPILIVLNQLLVAAKWGAPGGEPQREVLVRPWVKLDDTVPNILGRPLTGLGIVFQDNELHLDLQHGDNKSN